MRFKQPRILVGDRNCSSRFRAEKPKEGPIMRPMMGMVIEEWKGEEEI
jgi:hypothetical protein